MHGQWKLELGYHPLAALSRSGINFLPDDFLSRGSGRLYPDPFSVRILVAGIGINLDALNY